MTNKKFNNYPIQECAAALDEIMAKGNNPNKETNFYQKFTCAKCGARQTMSEKNKLFTSGECEECKHVTDIKKDGCNYMIIASIRRGANDNDK